MKKYLFSLFIGVIFLLGMDGVSAMTPTWPNNAKFSRGVGNTCYWISGSASGYTSSINVAADIWEYNGWANPIYLTVVSSNYATHIDFYSSTPSSDSVLNSNVLGYTTFWSSVGTLVSPKGIGPSVNYFYTEIIMNNTLSGSYDSKIIMHEMGHAFGLAHTGNQYSIMYPYANGMLVSTVQKVDVDTINYLY